MSNISRLQGTQPVFELARVQTGSTGVYVYRLETDAEGTTLVGFSGPTPGSSIDLGLASVIRQRDVKAPIILDRNAWADERFADLPEFRSYGFEAVVSVPLVDSGVIVGFANFCRREAGPVTIHQLGIVLNLSLLLAALIAAPILWDQWNKTVKRLEDRTVIERAKGLLQQSMGITEEQAYLHIRLLSRRRRIPMRGVAERLLQSGRPHAGSRHDTPR